MTIEERIERARNMVSRLCNGEQRWIMSIPAQPDTDPDLVIADGLRAGKETADRIEALARENAELKAELKQCRKEKNALVFKAYPAMDERDDLLKAASLAFGCLWRDLSGNLLAIDARKHLSAVLSRDAKKNGIEDALGRYGHPNDGETLAAVDRAFPLEYVHAAADAAKQNARAEAAEARAAKLVEALTKIAEHRVVVLDNTSSLRVIESTAAALGNLLKEVRDIARAALEENCRG